MRIEKNCFTRRVALISAGTMLTVIERPDTIHPIPLSAEIHYGRFYIMITFSEFIDSTPSLLVNLNKIFVSDETGRPANAPLYSDDNGKPLTYSNVYKALKIALEKAGLPKGAIGGHSGRIYMATLMASKNTRKKTKKR